MGGTISRLYASEYSRDVSGLVLVDYTPYDARTALSDEQWGYWKVLLGSPSDEALALYPDLERFDHQRNLEEVLAAAPLKPMPLIVLSSDEPYNLSPFVDDGTLPADIAEEFGNILFQAIVDARADLVSQVPGARHITDTDSGHYIHQEQPQLVIDSIREVVGAVRKLPESGGVGTWVAMAAALALMGCGIGAIALVWRSFT
jgi:pimeloyl-ACP methyl ester carboxylesterase